MAMLKRWEMRFLDQIFEMGSGYVLDFSNRTFYEFFEDEFGITIYEERSRARGTSKGNRLRAFIDAEDGSMVGKVLRRLWEHRSETQPALPAETEARFFSLVERIEASSAPPVLAALWGTASLLNFD